MKRNLQSAVLDFKKICCASDLKKNKMTLADYNVLGLVLSSLSHGQDAEFISGSVYSWLSCHGLKPSTHGVGWIIRG